VIDLEILKLSLAGTTTDDTRSRREPVRSAAAPAIDGTSPDTGGRRMTGLARPALLVAGGMPRQRRCGQFLARAARPRSGAPVV
jgi:hypothetical protein